MAPKNTTDISTPSIIRPQGAQESTLNLLPTRGEKRLLPSPISVETTIGQTIDGFSGHGLETNPLNFTAPVIEADYDLSAAFKPYTDFVVVYVQNRGTDGQGNPDASTNAIYRFLINPETVNISHTTLNSDSFDRGGWQFGVWGEDMVRVSMNGKTPGEYFILGLTDKYAEYTESFRNLQQLQDVFENNGYWFEGEEVDYGNILKTGTSGWSSSRRLIKMHQDVILAVKEFLWYGMFETLEISQDANNPYLASFSLTFVAWKERFRGDSPYYNAIANDVQRGNSYSSWQSSQGLPITAAPQAQTGENSGQSQTAVSQPGGCTTGTSPAAQAEQSSIFSPNYNPLASDFSPTQPIFNSLTTWFDDWTGVLNK